MDINPESDSALDLSSLLWEDILFKKVLPRLSILDLFNLRAASKNCRAMVDAYFVQMTTLHLTPFASKFTHSQFVTLSRLCSNLRQVKLASCEFVSTNSLIELFSRNTKITTLILDKTVNLESSCLQPVIVSCKNLKLLSLNECNWITVGCLDALTLHHESIEDVDLSFCYAFSGQHSLNCFLVKLPRLRTLRLAGLLCLDTTLTVISHCQDLELLDLSHGFSSSKRVKDLIETLPKLKFLDLRSHTFQDNYHTKKDLRDIAWLQNRIIVLTNYTYIHGTFLRPHTAIQISPRPNEVR